MNTASKIGSTFLLLAMTSTATAGPYSPAAGQSGSSAVSRLDSGIVEWASGYTNYIQGSPINAAYTNPAKALGPAQGTVFDITQLGDGGQITLTFARPIAASASGPDFAVFGNAFSDTYLKLAFVDVSQDGVHWSRMPNASLTPSSVSTFGAVDTTNIDGYAGKYRVGFGTPFSLRSVGLTSADFVRIVDIIGNGSDKDSSGRSIYDPSPNSNGFNVGGVGVFSVLSVPEPGTIISIVIGLGVVATGRLRKLVI
jgi:hypothetical protein